METRSISFGEFSSKSKETLFHRWNHRFYELILKNKYSNEIPIVMVITWLTSTNLALLAIIHLELYPRGLATVDVGKSVVSYWLCTAMLVYLHILCAFTHPGPVSEEWKRWDGNPNHKPDLPAYAQCNPAWEKRQQMHRSMQDKAVRYAREQQQMTQSDNSNDNHIAGGVSISDLSATDSSSEADDEIAPLITAGLVNSEYHSQSAGQIGTGAFPTLGSLDAPSPPPQMNDANDDAEGGTNKGHQWRAPNVRAMHKFSALLQHPKLKGLDFSHMRGGDVMKITPRTGLVRMYSEAPETLVPESRAGMTGNISSSSGSTLTQRRGGTSQSSNGIKLPKSADEAYVKKPSTMIIKDDSESHLFHYQRGRDPKPKLAGEGYLRAIGMAEDGQSGGKNPKKNSNVDGGYNHSTNDDPYSLERLDDLPEQLVDALMDPEMGFVIKVDGDVDFKDLGSQWDKVTDFKTYGVAEQKDETMVKITNEETGESMIVDPKLYCLNCSHWKPPRWHHCRTCNRCVGRMDHHCIWIRNCVGAETQRFFIQYLMYHLIYVIITTHWALYVLSILPLWNFWSLLMCFQLFWEGFQILFCGNLLQFQLRLLSKEQTQLEHLFHKKEVAKYSRGSAWDNLWFYLGPTPMHLLFPIPNGSQLYTRSS